MMSDFSCQRLFPFDNNIVQYSAKFVKRFLPVFQKYFKKNNKILNKKVVFVNY